MDSYPLFSESEKQIMECEYLLRNLIDIAVRYKFHHNEDGKKTCFFMFSSEIDKARSKFEGFRVGLRYQLENTKNKDIIKLDINERFLIGIRKYYSWYKDQSEYRVYFGDNNSFDLILNLAESVEKEIIKYFPELQITPAVPYKALEIQDILANNDLDFYYNQDSIIGNKGFFIEIHNYFETGARKGLFEPLMFMNLFWMQLEYFIKNAHKPDSTLKHFEALPITNQQRHILYCFILKFYGGYPLPISDIDAIQMSTALLLIEESFLRYEGDTPEKEFCRNVNQSKYLNDALISLEPLPESYQYTAKDFEGFAAKNNWDFYHNLVNIPNQTRLILPIKKYLQTGRRAGFIEPLALINLVWEQEKYFKENLSKPHSVITHFKALPFVDEVKHLLFGMLLKWHSGYPVNKEYFGSNDRQKTILLLIEKEFEAFEENTPEKWFCLKDQEREKRLNETKAMLDAEINSETDTYPEPVPLITSTKTRNIKESTKIFYQQIATFYYGRAKEPTRTNARFDDSAIQYTIRHFKEIKKKTYSAKYIQDAINWYNKNVKVR